MRSQVQEAVNHANDVRGEMNQKADARAIEVICHAVHIFLKQFQSLPFDDDAALIFGEVRAQLARIGRPIGPYDLQIAAIVLQHKLTLVTHNMAEFSRVPDLSCEDWENE